MPPPVPPTDRPPDSPVPDGRPATAEALRAASAALWEAQHAHPFVRGIGDGTLAEARFRFYVRQDYLFLTDYGRLLALGAARAPRLDWSRSLAELAHAIFGSEMQLHRDLAAGWGIPAGELERTAWAPATRAYTDHLLRTATLGDFAELVAALLPCMWSYAEIGERLAAAGAPDHPGYAAWIATYADPGFAELAGWCRAVTDAVATPAAAGAMHAAFRASSEHELAFWEAAWAAG